MHFKAFLMVRFHIYHLDYLFHQYCHKSKRHAVAQQQCHRSLSREFPQMFARFKKLFLHVFCIQSCLCLVCLHCWHKSIQMYHFVLFCLTENDSQPFSNCVLSIKKRENDIYIKYHYTYKFCCYRYWFMLLEI